MDPTITLPRATVQQALEAWEHINKYGFVLADYEGPMEQAITALKAALAQPVQEPVAWRLPDPDPEGRFEWVLYQTADFMPGVNPMDHFDGLEPLYTHPPRREWRGLSEEEIQSVIQLEREKRFQRRPPLPLSMTELSHAIEQALRSKNHD
jgi:hypothetical protein